MSRRSRHIKSRNATCRQVLSLIYTSKFSSTRFPWLVLLGSVNGKILQGRYLLLQITCQVHLSRKTCHNFHLHYQGKLVTETLASVNEALPLDPPLLLVLLRPDFEIYLKKIFQVIILFTILVKIRLVEVLVYI